MISTPYPHTPNIHLSVKETTLTCDATFSGFLTAVFIVFQQKLKKVQIQKEVAYQPSFYAKQQRICTDESHALRVWNGIIKKEGTHFAHRLFATYLSEKPQIENLLLRVIIETFANNRSIATDYGNSDILKVSQISKMVGREKHRMEAFVRFRLTQDEIYASTIEPDFDVLPLIRKHFVSRYADQKWLIYDVKRKYGLFYDLNQVDTIELPNDQLLKESNADIFHSDEQAFQELWKNYFKSTNIASRKNTKLHVRHVPKRYWKYLSEKSPY